VLVMSHLLPPTSTEGTLMVGELSLDGSVRHARGVLPMAAVARQQGFRRIFVPMTDAAEAALVPDLAGSEAIQPAYMAEALQYRPKVMME
jgi:magnesium chelatase family protein